MKTPRKPRKETKTKKVKSQPIIQQDVGRLHLDDALSQGSTQGWSDARIRAYKSIDTNPNGNT